MFWLHLLFFEEFSSVDWNDLTSFWNNIEDSANFFPQIISSDTGLN